MQKDFHYYAVLFLCLAAGFNREVAYKTALSALLCKVFWKIKSKTVFN